MPYLANYTGEAMGRLGNTLRNLPNDMMGGQLRLKQLDADLADKKFQRDRQNELYAMQKPGMERERDRVLAGNRPADFGSVMNLNDPARASFFTQDHKDGTPPVFEAFANYFGGKMQVNPKTGAREVVMPDGKPVPDWMLQDAKNSGALASIMAGYYSPEKGLKQKALEAKAILNSGDVTDPAEISKLQGIVSKYEKMTPNDVMDMNERHLQNLYADRDSLARAGARPEVLATLDRQIGGLENQNQSIRSAIAKEQERQQGLRDFMFKEDYKKRGGRGGKPGKFNKDTYTLPEDASPIQSYARDAFVTTYDMADKDAQDFLNLRVLPKYRTVVDSIGEDGTVIFGGKKITIETPENLQWLLSNIAAGERAKMTQGSEPKGAKDSPVALPEERRKELAAGGRQPKQKAGAPATPKQSGNFRVDAKGNIYETVDVTESGRRLERLVMKKPDKQIKSRKMTGNADMVMVGDELRDTGYNETVSDNPEYQKYIDTLKKYGLN